MPLNLSSAGLLSNPLTMQTPFDFLLGGSHNHQSTRQNPRGQLDTVHVIYITLFLVWLTALIIQMLYRVPRGTASQSPYWRSLDIVPINPFPRISEKTHCDTERYCRNRMHRQDLRLAAINIYGRCSAISLPRLPQLSLVAESRVPANRPLLKEVQSISPSHSRRLSFRSVLCKIFSPLLRYLRFLLSIELSLEPMRFSSSILMFWSHSEVDLPICAAFRVRSSIFLHLGKGSGGRNRSVACSYSLMKDLNVLPGFVDDLLICVAFSVRSSIFFFFHLWKESGWRNRSRVSYNCWRKIWFFFFGRILMWF